jgi:chemotaxis protein methyltransferase CheR
VGWTPSFVGADGITLRPDEFRLLRDLFAARTGLHFGPEARFSLERRLRERLTVLNLSSFTEYHHLLRFGINAAAEWDEAIELLTTHETYLFREERQLRAFENEILPMLSGIAAARRRLAIWSAGCSTGEEVYTLAAIVHASGLFPRDAPPESRWDVRIYGSDISRKCVATARRGLYGESSFRATPPEVRDRYFEKVQPQSPAGPGSGGPGGGWRAIQPIRELCHFGQLNLLDEDRTRVLGFADAVFCRNVLIYFDARARKAAIEALYERLNPGGVLLLGHSESLLNVSTAFALLHLRDDLVYRKPLSAREPEPPPSR